MDKFSIIVAHDFNRGIGKDDQIPWKLKDDLAWFKKVTTRQLGSTQNIVIMGRKTWDSLPKVAQPLPNRINFVISSADESKDGAFAFTSLETALECAYKVFPESRVFVIGGASIYEQAMEREDIDELFITPVYARFDCDKFFPNYEAKDFCVKKFIRELTENGLDYEIQIWHKDVYKSKGKLISQDLGN